MTNSVPGHSADHYVHRLDLADDPFASDFESDYFYNGAMRRQVLDQLVHFGRFSDQIVMLVGATGSGTSTLLDHAIFQLREVMDCCYINAEALQAPDKILESLCEQLQLHLTVPVSADEFLVALQGGIFADTDVEPILFAVDQAHFLSLEGYELLLQIIESASGMVRLLLVGEYQIEQLSMLANFDKEQIKLLELEPLSLSESGDYLQGLLQSVGYAEDLPFNADQLAVLQDQSAGNIAEILQLAPALLDVKSPRIDSKFRFGIPIAHTAAIGILIVALITSWLYQGGDEPEAAIDISEGIESHTVQLPLPELVKTETEGVVARGSIADIDDDVIEVSSGLAKRTVDTTEKTAKVEPEPLVVKKSAPKYGEANKAAPQQAANLSTDENASMPIAAKVAAQPLTSSKPLAAGTKGSSKKPPASKKSIDKELASANKAAITVPAKVKIESFPAREKRLLNLAGSDYVLQLMGSVDEKRTLAFVKRYVGRLPVTYFETRLKGKPWFVAIMGPYNSKIVAQAKVKQLPTELQKLRPWARSVAGVQKDIRAKRPQ